jgi:hypothetical protein
MSREEPMRCWGRLLVVVALTNAMASGSSAQVDAGGGPVGRVAVTAGGMVSFDSVPITLEALKTRLAELKQRHGVVWYYREAARVEPPKEAMGVVKFVVENHLPISMSTKPDYSDVVLPDGTTRPRAGGRTRN